MIYSTKMKRDLIMFYSETINRTIIGSIAQYLFINLHKFDFNNSKQMDKLKIAVVMGGYSDEDVVSIASGELIYAEIDRTKYDPYRVMILKNEWYMLDHNNKKIPVSRNDFTAQFG